MSFDKEKGEGEGSGGVGWGGVGWWVVVGWSWVDCGFWIRDGKARWGYGFWRNLLMAPHVVEVYFERRQSRTLADYCMMLHDATSHVFRVH